LTNIFDFSVDKERKICDICSEILAPKEEFSNNECQVTLNLAENINKGETHLVEMDFKKDLKDIIEKNRSEMHDYKKVLDKKSSLDFCNTKSA
jgi:hypothetical protein